MENLRASKRSTEKPRGDLRASRTRNEKLRAYRCKNQREPRNFIESRKANMRAKRKSGKPRRVEQGRTT